MSVIFDAILGKLRKKDSGSGGGGGDIGISDVTGLSTALANKVDKASVGSANGVASLNASGKVPESELDRFLPVITIPAATTAYTLSDGNFVHAPSSAPTYTLPNVADDGIAHCINLDIDFTTVQTCAFVDAGGNVIGLQKDIYIDPGDRYRMICIHQHGMWLVYPLKMLLTKITAASPVSVSGTAGTALTSVQLSATADNSRDVTYYPSGMPDGVSCSSAGVISGTPTTAGSTSASVVARADYATPVTIVVDFTIAAEEE